MTEEIQEAPQLKCIYGNKVKLQNLATQAISEYTLVPLIKEVLSENKISNYTTVGKAIWAKSQGAQVSFSLDGSQSQSYKIIEVDHA